jgi:hypothetical protein
MIKERHAKVYETENRYINLETKEESSLWFTKSTHYTQLKDQKIKLSENESK